jgi:dipeptidyl aminopeptidase/acylaminoacyl peptidase
MFHAAMRRPRAFILAALLAAPLPAAPLEKQLDAIYQPFRVAQAALAPDGQHVAFALRESRGIELLVFSVDRPGEKTHVSLDAVHPPADVRWMAWADAERVVVVTDPATITVVNRSGPQARLVTDVKELLPPAKEPPLSPPSVRVLGLLPDEADTLLLEITGVWSGGSAPSVYIDPSPSPYEVEGGGSIETRPRFIDGAPLPPERHLALIRLNLRTGQRQTVFDREVTLPGATLVADRQGRPRLLLDRGHSPQRFQYLPADAKFNAWRTLDRVLNDAGAFAFHITPANFLGHRTIPLGFDFDPNVLYFASNLGRDTYGVYAMDLRTGRRTDLAVEEPDTDLVELAGAWETAWEDAPLILDRGRRTLTGVRFKALANRTRWLDPDLAEAQRTLDRKFPGREVELLGWDDAHRHFLALIATPDDPGRFFVFHRNDGRCMEYLRRAPRGLAPEESNRTVAFAFDAPDGGRIDGYLTLPRVVPVAKPALLVWLHDGPWQRFTAGFHRDAQAFAAMGFAVAEINYRGSSGTGVRQREALRQNFDRGPIGDVLAALAWIQPRHPFDPKRVAAGGEGFGGYLALRALELHPEVFRSGVSLNGVTDLDQYRRSEEETRQFRRSAERRSSLMPDQMLIDAGVSPPPPPPVDFPRELWRWFYGEPLLLTKFSAIDQAARLTRPVFLLHDPRNRINSAETVKAFRDAVRARSSSLYLELPSAYTHGVPSARVAVTRRIGEFLNVTLYDFDVKIGEAKEKP